jgi:Fic family protein
MPGATETRRWTDAFGSGKPLDIDVFIPDRLADHPIRVTGRGAIAAAEQALAEIGGEGELLREVGPVLLRSEGIASSRIEGLFLSTRRLFEAGFAPDAVTDRSAEQVLANMAIMEDILDHASDPVSEAMIRSWHTRLLGPHAPDVLELGRWRTRQNWIGGDALTPRGAEFIPPPPDLVPELMDDLVSYCARVDVGGIVQAAVAHAQFETIHPFADGNGRVGRALIYRILAARGVIGPAAPPLSPILVHRRDEYIAGLNAYRSGAVDRWADFFSEVVVEAVQYARGLLQRLNALRGEWEERLADVRSDALAHRVAADLVMRPVLDRALVARAHGVSGEAAANALKQLAERKIVEERPLRRSRRGRPARVYEAVEVFRVLDAT